MSASGSSSSQHTFFEYGAAKLRALAAAIGFDQPPGDPPGSIVGLFGRLISPWGVERISERPRWPSEVGDDHTPYEFSVAFGKAPELRVLFEPLGDPPSLVANREVGLALHPWLAREHGIDLDRFERIRDLFLPAKPQGSFSLWYAATFWRDRSPDFKIYLNPQAWGPEHAEAIIEAAMVRLGFPRSWPHVAKLLRRGSGELDELRYFSLDLAARKEARVKVYVRHHLATPADLEAGAAEARSTRAGDVQQFLHEIAGPELRVYSRRPPATCLSFVSGHGEAPSAFTLHFPINGYARDDQEIHDRVTPYLTRQGLDAAAYERVAAALIERPLAGAVGQQSYVSFRSEGAGQRVTVYFPPELYAPGRIDVPRAPEAPGSNEAWARHLRAVDVKEHPLLAKLARGPLERAVLGPAIVGTTLALLHGAANERPALAARVHDETVIAWLAGAWTPPGGAVAPEAAWSDAATQLTAKVAAILRRDDVHEGLGALVFVELLASQLLEAVTDARVPQGLAEARALELAAALPVAALAPAWRGGREALTALASALDSLYTLV